MMIKILVYALTKRLGGIENFMINYSQNFSDNIRLDFITIDKNISYWERLNKNNNRIYYMPRRREGEKKRQRVFNQIVKNTQYDLFWFNSNDLCDIGILKMASESNIKKIICHAHNSTTDRMYRRFFHKLHIKKANKYIDYKFACSTNAARFFYGNGKDIDAKNIYNAVDVDKFRFNEEIRKQLREKLDIDNETIVIGNVGRLCKQKNQSKLIDLFNIYHQQNSNSVLIILGQGELYKALLKKIEKMHLKDCAFLLGQVKNVYEYLMAFDMMWMPSIYEGLPVTLVEAQATGLPCIVSDVITKEVAITDLIKYLSISDANKWANSVWINENRDESYNKLLNSHFNIKCSSLKLEEYFTKEVK